MSEMIERVARALVISQGYDPDYVAHGSINYGSGPIPDSPKLWQMAAPIARDAIQAMRKPTRTMLDIGNATAPDAERTWDDMIHEARR